jgi:hypothetical protein
MKIPQYITPEEVRNVCKALGISDWTKKKKPTVSGKEADAVFAELKPKGMKIDPEEFRRGLEVELEHGLMFRDANVTNNHPLLTGLIVIAHFKETLDYYRLLDVAEAEGDLVKAMARGDLKAVKKYYRKLSQARIELNQAVMTRLGR